MADDTETTEDKRKFVEYADDDPNLAKVFPEEELKKIADKVKRDYDKAFESSEEYRERRAKNWAIFAGELPPKTFPYEGCANVHVPFMLETLTRLAFRLSTEIVGNWEGPLHFISTETETDDLAELVEAHQSWQYREGIPDFRRQFNRALLSFVNQGDVTSYSSYDAVARRNRHETLSVDEFVVPYTMTTTAPDWSDVPFTCRLLLPYKHELEELAGSWNGVEEVLEKVKEPTWEDEPETKLADKAAEVQGTQKDEDTPAPYKTILYEGWMKLPGQERHRYVQARVHYGTGTVFTLAIHEMPDWKDKQRFDREMSDKDQFFSLQQSHANAMNEAGMAIEQIQNDAMQPGLDPMMAENLYGQLQQTTRVQEQLKMEVPQPPVWMDPMLPPEEQKPREPRMVPIHLYAHAVAIEPLVGNLGIGYGRIEADYNRSANTALSQYIDAATMANCWGFITSDIVKFKEKFQLKPGFINKVTGLSMEQVKANIFELKGAPPNDSLIRVVDMVGSYAQQVAQAPNVLSGEPGKSGETYRGMATRIDQAVKQMSYLAQEFGQFLVQIGRNNMLLNSMFLDEEELFPFVNPQTKQGSIKSISRRVYEKRFTVELRSDVQFSSRQQRIQEANELMGMVGALPPLQQNAAFVYQAIVKTLKARGLDEMIPFLGEPPPPPESFMPPPPPPGPVGATGKPSAETSGPQLPAPPENPLVQPQSPIPGPGGALAPQEGT